jgi:hypothetical protein
MLPKSSHGKSIHHCLTKWLPFQQSVVDVCLNFRIVTVLWQFSGSSDSNLDIMVLQHCPQEGDMNNFITEAVSVIEGRVAQ